MNLTNGTKINTLYCELRDGVLDGSLPVTLQQAIKLAALQLRIDHDNVSTAAVHSKISWSLKDVLPKEHVRNNKDTLVAIKKEQESTSEMSTTEFKHRYTLLCQSLPTYGVTFFPVKKLIEDAKVARLLGVSKESIIQLDERSKEVLHTWSLACVCRWLVTSTTFSLYISPHDKLFCNSIDIDLPVAGLCAENGNKEESHSFQTGLGEQIGQLLGGYMNILKAAKERRTSQVNMSKIESCTSDNIV